MRNISIRKMWVYVCAIEEGSFTEGARRANISQPAAISIIGEIEETVGEELFERSGKTRRATPTQRGNEVYDTFVRTLAVYERALEAISAGKRPRRVQKILIQTPYAASVSALWLSKLIEQETDSQTSIRSASWQEIMNAIENREDCMALVDGEIRLKNSEYISIGNVEMVLIIPDNYSNIDPGQSEVAWEDVPSGAVIYSDLCPNTLERIYENLKMAQKDAGDFIEVNCPSVLSNFCSKAGIPAIAPKNLIDAFGDELRLRWLPFSYSKLFIPIGLSISHGNRMRSKVIGKDIDNVFERRFYI
ncbi:LysR family transcriptional regulator [Chelativorans sp. Marseille-P2723]|uniref:LysR family transcriptional regulator n=1 Tax=Chelativorans sp. Marseille-P2723 TaxID=2709133 RepID=UPI001570C844|nr:LysR family transcriptional regulator [Chelativorans sp. Marseille-P2723]